MRDFLAGWLIVQLVVIGVAGAFMTRDIANKTYDCGVQKVVVDGKEISIPKDRSITGFQAFVIGATFPLIFFTDGGIDAARAAYCANK